MTTFARDGRRWLLGIALAFGVGAIPVQAQDPKAKDDALEKLLGKVEARDKAEAAKEQSKPGEVAPRDKALDDLLKKFGTTEDRPTPDKPMPPTPGGPGKAKSEPGPDQGKSSDKPKQDTLKDEAKDLDRHLEELLGRKPKSKKSQQQGEGEGQPGQGEENGPLSDVIKKMREVEQRLGKTDTGDQTREEQKQIVQKLDTILEQIRKSGQSGSSRMLRKSKQQGPPQQGDPSQDPGAMARGAPPMKPSDPTNKRSLVGGKDVWGHLPPELRTEMENIFKEEMLPTKEELIRRYYLSVAKKNSPKKGE